LDLSENLNPRVKVKWSHDNIESMGVEFFQQFNFVCMVNCSLSVLMKVNSLCREVSGIKPGFLACWNMGMLASVFVDLTTFICKDRNTFQENKLEFPSLKEVLQCSSDIPKVILLFEATEKKETINTEFGFVSSIMGGLTSQIILSSLSHTEIPIRNFLEFTEEGEVFVHEALPNGYTSSNKPLRIMIMD